MIVLDTDHITLLSRDTNPIGQRLGERLIRIRPEERATTIVTFEEQSRGWLAVLSKTQSVARLIEGYRHLSEHLENYRSIRVLEYLKKSRIRIGTMDLRIASIVLSRGATLLSRNLGDFRKVPNLKVEDWCV
jgi:tRNA(fMet)-specific endonuclease VapC